MSDELSELVNSPEERPEVEYKAWLDLTDNKHRANIARHIAALANLGGGHIVFGINDDMTSCGPAPDELLINHDAVASITKKYLEPALHCDVRTVKSSGGIDHPIIRVPPHGATPICAKANGPASSTGKVEGIVAGTYYLRKAGPESSPIITAAEWRDVIRRCALHDRAAILSAVTAALSTSSATGTSSDAPRSLEAWSRGAAHRYLSLVGDTKFAAPVQECRIQLSYCIITEADSDLPFDKLEQILFEVGGEVDQHVQSGWSLFYVFRNEPLTPKWMQNPGVEDDEYLEANTLLPDRTIGLDLWRVSPRGLATVIREYWEDTQDFGGQPRTTLNPKLMAKTIGELVRHAEALSSRFSVPTSIAFRCEWIGLSGRRLVIPHQPPIYTSGVASTDQVITTGTWAVGALDSELPVIVAKLGSKVARALNWTGFTPQWVANQIPSWKRS